MDRKPAWQEQECGEGHMKRLHSTMKVKCVRVNAAINIKEDAEEDEMVSVATRCSNMVWKTPDVVWFMWKL
jgi:hypothetical protein